MKRNLTIFLLALFLLASGVGAWWVVHVEPVTSCFDSDGLNFTNQGYINVTGNYSGTFYDSCANNITVTELACSSDVYNITGYALAIQEDCTALNLTGCSLGKCI